MGQARVLVVDDAPEIADVVVAVRVVGLTIGSDDVTMPFSPRELGLRFDALLQRRRATAPRKKLAAAGAPAVIATVRGVGYRLAPDLLTNGTGR